MGCVPPQKRNNSIPATNVVASKSSNVTSKWGQSNKNMEQNNENNQLQVPIPKLASNDSLKSRKKNSLTDLGNLQRQSLKKYSYEYQETPLSPKQKDIILIHPPPVHNNNHHEQTSNIHSLDIVSKIKPSKTNNKKGQIQQTRQPSKVQEINITFNHNDFGTIESKNKSLQSKSKNWRFQTLKNELQQINNENFMQIKVTNRTYE